jgi:hypothetical protein
LRKGETVDSTKDIRTSSGTFVRAKEEKTGALDWVEEKMARATMIPRAHGEDPNWKNKGSKLTKLLPYRSMALSSPTVSHGKIQGGDLVVCLSVVHL